jgi:DNA-binding protein YbaB
MTSAMNEEEEARYAEMSRSAIAALDTMEATARRLAAVEVEAHSPDGRVTVRVTASGTVTAVRLRPGTLRRYGSVRLGEVVSSTLRAAQLRAREEYEHAVAAHVPEEVVEAQRAVEEAGLRSEANRKILGV